MGKVTPAAQWLRETYDIDLVTLSSGSSCINPADIGLITQDAAKYGLVPQATPATGGKYAITIPEKTFEKIKHQLGANRAKTSETTVPDAGAAAWVTAVESATRCVDGTVLAQFQLTAQPLCVPGNVTEQAGVGVVVRMIEPTFSRARRKGEPPF